MVIGIAAHGKTTELDLTKADLREGMAQCLSFITEPSHDKLPFAFREGAPVDCGANVSKSFDQSNDRFKKGMKLAYQAADRLANGSSESRPPVKPGGARGGPPPLRQTNQNAERRVRKKRRCTLHLRAGVAPRQSE